MIEETGYRFVDDVMETMECTTIEQHGKKITICSVKLNDNFILTDTSCAVNNDDYNIEMGKRVCYDRLEHEVWKMKGFLRSFKS